MTAILPVPNQSNIFTALRSFLLAVLPDGIPVLQGQANRVPEPKAANFVIMTPMRQMRIATNLDEPEDSLFTASIAGAVMTVASISIGPVALNHQLFGTGVVDGSKVLSQLSGVAGGTGAYSISPSQAMSLSPVSGGSKNVTQSSWIVIQVDVYGPSAMDNAQTITTLFRDEYAATQFATSGFDVTPLYADDPKQAPFIDAENQYEDRWTVEVQLQANQIVNVPQQFADEVTIDVISVDTTYPPA